MTDLQKLKRRLELADGEWQEEPIAVVIADVAPVLVRCCSAEYVSERAVLRSRSVRTALGLALLDAIRDAERWRAYVDDAELHDEEGTIRAAMNAYADALLAQQADAPPEPD